MKRRGVYNDIKRKLEERKESNKSKIGLDIKNWALKTKPLKEDSNEREEAIYSISPSKNILFYKKTLNQNTEKLREGLKNGDIREYEISEGNNINDYLKGTHFELDELYDIKHKNIM